MDKRAKIILITIFAIVITLGMSLGFVLQDYLRVTSQSQVINLEEDLDIPEEIDDLIDSKPPGKPAIPINPPFTDTMEYKGQNYTVFREGKLKAIGPNTVKCPYCEGNATQIGSNIIKGWYYYYYQCESCEAYLAEYAKSS